MINKLKSWISRKRFIWSYKFRGTLWYLMSRAFYYKMGIRIMKYTPEMEEADMHKYIQIRRDIQDKARYRMR